MSESVQHICNDCGQVFASMGRLELHLQLYVCKRNYFCHYCNEGFLKMDKLNAHLKMRCRSHMKRRGRLRSLCKICGQKFPDIIGLNEHVNSYHTDVKPYACSVCSEGYATVRDLSKHIRAHKSEKCFSCGCCDKRFWKQSELENHSKVHVRVSHFVCKICDLFFAQEDSLNAHIGIHMDDKDPLCTLPGEEDAGSEEESGKKICTSDEREQGGCYSKAEELYVKEERGLKEEIDIKDESFEFGDPLSRVFDTEKIEIEGNG